MYCYYIILPLPEVKSKITLYCSEIIFCLTLFLDRGIIKSVLYDIKEQTVLICDKVFSNSASEQPCKLMHYSHLLFNKVWETEEHSHPLCEIAYILSGLGEYVQNGVSVPVKKGDLFIMNAYTPHFERSSPADPLEHIFFSIDIIGFEEKIKATGNDTYLLHLLNQPDEQILHYDLSKFLSYFTELAHTFDTEIEQKPPLWEQNLQHRFHLALILILRQISLNRLTQKTINLNNNERIPIAIAHYLDANFTFEHSLDELSKRFFISKSYLLSSFKKTYGMTPMQYLNKARIREAQRTLQSTDFAVNNVAAQTGFTNASHFARIYKKYTGITPSQEIKKALHSRQNKPN